MIEIIKGSLLDAKEKFIAHSCNAASNQAGGLAHYVYKKFPHADIYSNRPFPFKASVGNFPGHVMVRGNGSDKRYVINMIAQLYPGTPNYPLSLLDGLKTREGYFKRCLWQISLIEKLESIAFPVNICDTAGGNWDNYFTMLNLFAVNVNNYQPVKVFIYDDTRK